MNQYYFIQDKVTDIKGLANILSVYRFKEKKIVFTHGCFDLMHRGHIEFLSKSSDLGDILIIGLHSDISAGKIKGQGRPIQDHGTRSIVLAAIKFVNHVVLFDDVSPLGIIEDIKPDILVKGGECVANDNTGIDFVTSIGGKIVNFDLLSGYSTEGIIKKIKDLK